MKKILISVILMLAIWMSLAACSPSTGDPSTGDSSSGSDTIDTEEKQAICELLNELSRASYKTVRLDITTQTGELELKGEYVLTAKEVTYLVERMNLLPEDGDPEGVSPDAKTVLKGSATIENGTVTKLDGDAVELPDYDALKGAFDFKESYFQNVEKKNGAFYADVVSAGAFLGTDQALNNVKLTVQYNDSALEKMVITYQTANATVTTEYVFEA